MKVLNIEDCKKGTKVKVTNIGNGIIETHEGYIEDISSFVVSIKQTNVIKTVDIAEMYGKLSGKMYLSPSEVKTGEIVLIKLMDNTVVEGSFMGYFSGLPTSIMLKTLKSIPRTKATIWQP